MKFRAGFHSLAKFELPDGARADKVIVGPGAHGFIRLAGSAQNCGNSGLESRAYGAAISCE